MKKGALLVVLLFAFAVVLTGCDKKEDKKNETKNTETKKTETKTLACSVTEEDDEYV